MPVVYKSCLYIVTVSDFRAYPVAASAGKCSKSGYSATRTPNHKEVTNRSSVVPFKVALAHHDMKA